LDEAAQIKNSDIAEELALPPVKIRVCLPRKYGRFMLFIDNNLLLPGARLHIPENDNNFGYGKITIVVDNIPLRFIIAFAKGVLDLQID
jgi:hypothetical protein